MGNPIAVGAVGGLVFAVRLASNIRDRARARKARNLAIQEVGGKMADRATRAALKDKTKFQLGLPTCAGCPEHSGIFGNLRVFGIGGKVKIVCIDRLVLLCSGLRGKVVLAPGASVADWGLGNFLTVVRTGTWDEFYSECNDTLSGKAKEAFGGRGAVADRLAAALPVLTRGAEHERREVARMFGQLAEVEDNRALIAELGGVEPLVEALKSGSEPVKEVAAWAVINASFKNLSNQGRVIDAGAVPALVEMLGSSSVKSQKGAAGALMNLSSNNDEKVHLALIEAGVLPRLLSVLESGEASVQERSAGVLRNLAGRARDGRFSAVGADLLAPVVSALHSPDEGVQEQAAGAIRNIAAQGDGSNKRALLWAGGIPPLVKLLSSGNPRVQEHAAGALKAIAVDPNGLKEQVAWAGAIRPLVRALSGPSSSARVNAARALATILAKREGAEEQRKEGVREAVEEGAINDLVAMLRDGSGSAQEAAAIVIGEIAGGGRVFKPALEDGGAIPALNAAKEGVPSDAATAAKVRRAVDYAISKYELAVN